MIGLFDSGIGGLTVVREVMRRLPAYSLLYLGDTARTPYGNKSSEVVREYGLQAAKFLINNGAQIIVVACNTVSAVGLEALRKAFPHTPIFDVITPAIAAVKKISQGKHIGVMGTRALVNSGVYQDFLTKANGYHVTARAAPLLVPLVEEGWFDRPETKRIIKRYLAPFKQAQIDTLVLACTHYPWLKSLIAKRIGKRVKVIDPAEETALVLVNWLAQNKAAAASLPTKGELQICLTDVTPQNETIANHWLKRTVKLKKVELK
jgi:glutamate racemase